MNGNDVTSIDQERDHYLGYLQMIASADDLLSSHDLKEMAAQALREADAIWSTTVSAEQAEHAVALIHAWTQEHASDADAE